jgi:hypothetical protein
MSLSLSLKLRMERAVGGYVGFHLIGRYKRKNKYQMAGLGEEEKKRLAKLNGSVPFHYNPSNT